MDLDKSNRMTILMLSDDLNKAMTTFLIAKNAASKGMEVNLFFMSCGIKVIKKGAKIKLPGLLWFFTWIAVKRMKDAGIEGLDIQIETAKELGVKIYGCKTCADLVRIKKEKFIAGAELVEREKYIDLVRESGVHLVLD